MTKDADFKLVKIQSCVLRVNIHCDGCKHKVTKLLQRIEGVYKVSMDSEQQQVTVSGIVNSETLIKKLLRAGKHAELWSQKTNQHQNQKANCNKNDKNTTKGQKQNVVMKSLESIKDEQNRVFAPKGGNECPFDDEDDDEEYGEEEMQLFREKMNQLAFLEHQAEANANRAITQPVGFGSNNGNMNNKNDAVHGNNKNGGKKGNSNQNTVSKGNGGCVINPKTLAAMKMSNAQLSGANLNHFPDGKNGNDISAMMNLAGFHGNGATNNIGGNDNNGFRGGFPMNGLTTGHNPSQMMMNMNGFQQHNNISPMMMNFQNMQPQMTYNTSPLVHSSSGYYYNYGHSYVDPGYGGDHATSHTFSDENTSSCSVM